MNLKTTLAFPFSVFIMNTQAQLADPDKVPVPGGTLIIQPIRHATFVLGFVNKTIYVDPTGEAANYQSMNAPDLILITGEQPDHFDPETLKAIGTDHTVYVVPRQVARKIPPYVRRKQVVIIQDGDKTMQAGVGITAFTKRKIENVNENNDEEAVGYLLSLNGKLVYISGDAAITPFPATKIDIAFVSMNLVNNTNSREAVDAIVSCKPAIIYPYSYGESDPSLFKTAITKKDAGIDIRLRNWYPY